MDVESLLIAAWKVESPGEVKGVDRTKFPRGFWPNIARRALDWQQRNLSDEQIEAEVRQAAREWEEKWDYIAKTAPARKPAATRSVLGAQILGDISFD